MEKKQVLAYYFPNWHPTERNDNWHGKNWTEWEVTKHATPRFEGHKQPKIPLWGYEDESDPIVMEKKIEAAVSHGVDGFIFDWYWFEDGPYRIDCLDKGFLGAKNCEDAKFAVMWANHDPIYVHPASRMYVAPPLLSGDISPEAFITATNHCINTYFTKPNYLRIDGKIYFSIWNLEKFISNFGGVEATKLILNNFRQRARDAGVGELHLNANFDNISMFRKDINQANEIIKKCGIDSCGIYGLAMNSSLSFPHMLYKECVDASVEKFKTNTDICGVPYYINVATGWDSSPRTVQSEIYGDYGYPFCRIINDSTPEIFEEFLKKARDFADKNEKCKIITIGCWNEWTEGAYLEPDTEFGYGYLEAVERVFKK